MTPTATYNRTAIMTEAHTAAKACVDHVFYKGRSYASLFAVQLSRVWAETKRRVGQAIQTAEMSPADRTRNAIAALEGKDRWTKPPRAASAP